MSKTFVIFRKNDNYNNLWIRFIAEVETNWGFLDVQEIGERFGEGQFVYWDADSQYPQVKEITVVGVTRYEETNDEAEEADDVPPLTVVD